MGVGGKVWVVGSFGVRWVLGGELEPQTSNLRPQTSDLRPHSGDFHHIPEKSFFYLQRTVIVEKKVLNRVLKMPKRPLADCGFEKPYFLHEF